jgi:hypothetical protein
MGIDRGSEHGLSEEDRALVQRIHDVFPAEPLGDGISLFQALHEDKAWELSGEAYERARARDAVDDWRAVRAEDLEAAFLQCSVTTYMNLASYRFYLPAFLCHALRTGEGAFFIFRFVVTQPPNAFCRWLELSQPQMDCVVAFVCVYARDNEGERAQAEAWLALWTGGP